jgi:hypothetical protein
VSSFLAINLSLLFIFTFMSSGSNCSSSPPLSICRWESHSAESRLLQSQLLLSSFVSVFLLSSAHRHLPTYLYFFCSFALDSNILPPALRRSLPRRPNRRNPTQTPIVIEITTIPSVIASSTDALSLGMLIGLLAFKPPSRSRETWAATWERLRRRWN